MESLDAIVRGPDAEVMMIVRGLGTPTRRGPRIRVIDLSLWTIGCALGFGVYQGLTPSLNDGFRLLGWVYDLVMGVVFGTILVGAGALVGRRRRGDQAVPSLAGHWLLLFGLVAVLAAGLAMGVYQGMSTPLGNPETAYWVIFDLAFAPNLVGVYHQVTGWGLGALASLAFLVGLRRRLGWHWLSVFLVFFAASALLAGAMSLFLFRFAVKSDWSGLHWWCFWAPHVYAGSVVVGLSAILLGIARDLWIRARTDGLHWTGVGVWLAIALMQIATYVRFLWLP